MQECLVAFGESIERRIKGGKGKVLQEVQGIFERIFGERLMIHRQQSAQKVVSYVPGGAHHREGQTNRDDEGTANAQAHEQLFAMLGE